MATNHTTNYQLNLWEPGDSFLREEFNQNSQKINAALEELAARTTYVPLLDITTSAQASQVNLDVSEIDFTKWKMVRLTYDQASDGGSGIDSQLLVRLNGRSDEIYSNYTSNGYNGIACRNRDYLVKAETFGSPACRNITIDFYPATSNGLRVQMDDLLVSDSLASYYHSSGAGFTNVLTFATITQINFTGTVPAGTHLRLWGIN